MKLIYCPLCEDVVRLVQEVRRCRCLRSSGCYVDDLQAVIAGEAIPLGVAWGSFLTALAKRPRKGNGKRFEAFVIPRECPTIEKRERL